MKSLVTKWFTDAVSKLTDKIPEGMVDITSRKTPPIGEIVLFKYDPKTKSKLPYYDENPLVLITSFNATGFSGINLHYIPPNVRKSIVAKLVEYKDRSTNPHDYIRRALPLLSAMSANDVFGHSYKNYLGSHVRSRFAIVGVDHWKFVSALPLQKFKKESASKVWAQVKMRGY